MDPVYFFPYEVFTKIIYSASYEEYHGPLTLLSVSPQWDKTILETPEIWTCLKLNHWRDSSDPAERLERVWTFLHLSRNEPIDLYAASYNGIPQFEGAFGLIVRHAHQRIRSITISPLVLDIFSDFQKLEGAVFPILEEISLPEWGRLSSSFLAACPVLRNIRRFFLTNEEVPHLSHSTKTIGFSFRQESELSVLADRSFISLEILNKRLVPNEEKETDFFAKTMANAIRYLERFTFSTLDTHATLSGFLTIMPVRLQYLRVSLPPDMTEYFISSLPFFPLLSELTVWLANTNAREQKWPVHPPPSPSSNNKSQSLLRQFNLLDPTRKREQSHIEELIRCVNKYSTIQNCSNLILALRGGPAVLPLVIPLLENTPRLYELHLLVWSGYELKIKKQGFKGSVTLPNSMKLTIDDINCLSVILMPNLETLEVKVMGIVTNPFPSVVRILQTEAVDGSMETKEHSSKVLRRVAQQTQITKLTWTLWSRPRESFVVALRSLTMIALFDNYERDTKRNNPLNSLCFALLYGSEEACPSLTTIHSHIYPLWDLLFTTLQYRIKSGNAPGSGVKAITTISLPGFPAVPILRQLTKLLQGDPNTVIFGFDSIIQDRFAISAQSHMLTVTTASSANPSSRTTCAWCLCSGYTHCVDSPVNEELDCTLEIKDLIPMHPENAYKGQEYWEDVLAGKGNLLKGGKECKRQEISYPVTINAFTPIGDYSPLC